MHGKVQIRAERRAESEVVGWKMGEPGVPAPPHAPGGLPQRFYTCRPPNRMRQFPKTYIDIVININDIEMVNVAER